MVSKRVFIFAAMLCCVAGFAFAQTPSLITGVLQMPVDGSGVAAGTLDLTDNAAQITNVQTAVAPYTSWTSVANNAIALQGFVTTGYNAGAWNGLGIQSSYAATNSTANMKYELAVYSGADLRTKLGLTSFVGVTIPSDGSLDNTGFIKFTYQGDVNGSGSVTTADATLIKSSILYQNANGVGSIPISWVNGDINYDGLISTADATLTKASILYQNANGNFAPLTLSAGGLAPLSATSSSNVVPEPSTLLLLVLAFASLVASRKIWK